jgi:hypothetical protein
MQTMDGRRAKRLGLGFGFVTGGPYLLVPADVKRVPPVNHVAPVRAETADDVELSSVMTDCCPGSNGVFFGLIAWYSAAGKVGLE